MFCVGELAVRNPDKWQPPEPGPDDPPAPRRGAVIGLVVIVALIVGGLLLSQVLTLYTTPVVYLYLDRRSLWFKARRIGTAGSSRRPAPQPGE